MQTCVWELEKGKGIKPVRASDHSETNQTCLGLSGCHMLPASDRMWKDWQLFLFPGACYSHGPKKEKEKEKTKTKKTNPSEDGAGCLLSQ